MLRKRSSARTSGPVVLEERLKVHRDSSVTERDFAYLANHGINAVRIPVPFFVFGDYPPRGALGH
jgi:aryl-phospho-beta-D-glucosidase BglC (GH1 family)